MFENYRRIVFLQPFWNCEPGDTAQVHWRFAMSLERLGIARRRLPDEDEPSPGEGDAIVLRRRSGAPRSIKI